MEIFLRFALDNGEMDCYNVLTTRLSGSRRTTDINKVKTYIGKACGFTRVPLWVFNFTN